MSLYLPLVNSRLSRYLFFTRSLPSAARRPLPALDLRLTCTLRGVAHPFTLPNLYLLDLPFTPPWLSLDCIYTAYLCRVVHNYSRRRPLLNLDDSFTSPLLNLDDPFANPLLSARASTFERTFDYAPCVPATPISQHASNGLQRPITATWTPLGPYVESTW